VGEVLVVRGHGATGSFRAAAAPASSLAASISRADSRSTVTPYLARSPDPWTVAAMSTQSLGIVGRVAARS
jgi:hypothetical protein